MQPKGLEMKDDSKSRLLYKPLQTWLLQGLSILSEQMEPASYGSEQTDSFRLALKIFPVL